jgi:acyl carrier protein
MAEGVPLSPATVLLGQGGLMDSLMLVNLLLGVEDFCLENGIPFEWAQDAAMSEKRSHYRTIGTLADYLHDLSRPSAGQG